MRSFGKRFWRVALSLGALGFASGLWADVIDHSGLIVQGTLRQDSDERAVMEDVTVYLQVFPKIKAGATVPDVTGRDNASSGRKSRLSNLAVDDSLLAECSEAKPITFTSKWAF